MILDDIADLITECRKTETTAKIARRFGRERKWIYMVESGCGITLDWKFIAGLHSLGYELKLEKIEK